jgi:hypothetical protein
MIIREHKHYKVLISSMIEKGDNGETRDVAAIYPEKVRELGERIDSYLETLTNNTRRLTGSIK